MKTILDPDFIAQTRQRYRRIERATGWMKHIPVIGNYISAFWFRVLDDGIIDTLTPRWGGLTFSYLNDGYGATVWHTWQSMKGGEHGIYAPCRAPRNRREADLAATDWAAYAKIAPGTPHKKKWLRRWERL